MRTAGGGALLGVSSFWIRHGDSLVAVSFQLSAVSKIFLRADS
jgi:hypothetical protein